MNRMASLVRVGRLAAFRGAPASGVGVGCERIGLGGGSGRLRFLDLDLSTDEEVKGFRDDAKEQRWLSQTDTDREVEDNVNLLFDFDGINENTPLDRDERELMQDQDDAAEALADYLLQDERPYKELVYLYNQKRIQDPRSIDYVKWLLKYGPKSDFSQSRPYPDEETIILVPPKKYPKAALDREEELGKRRRVMDMIIQGHDKRMIEAAERVALAARMLPNTTVVGLSPMRTQVKKWSILSGPFKFSRGREHIALVRLRRRLVIDTDRKTSEQFHAYLKINQSPLISIRCRTHDYIPLKEMSSYHEHLEDVGRGDHA